MQGLTKYQRYYAEHRDRILHRYDHETPEHREHRLALHRKHNLEYKCRKRKELAQAKQDGEHGKANKHQNLCSNGKDKSRHTTEYYREYRRKNREKILAREKLRRATRKLTPEQIEKKRKSNERYRKNHCKNFGVGRGNAIRVNSLKHMTPEERKAHRAAGLKTWRDNHKEKCEQQQREYRENHREEQRSYRLKHRETHYQKCLEEERRHHRNRNDKNRKIPYRAKPSMRIPEYATCPAHARWLEQCGEVMKHNATVNFQHAIQSGLTVGTFSA